MKNILVMVEKEFEFGVVPHYTDRNDPWLDCVAREQGALIIDVTLGVQEFVDQLCKCKVIASSSLHGLIAARLLFLHRSLVFVAAPLSDASSARGGSDCAGGRVVQYSSLSRR